MKTLFKAIQNALISGPLMTIDQSIHDHVRDFLAQEFTKYVLKYPHAEKILRDLFDKIVNENQKTNINMSHLYESKNLQSMSENEI